MNFISIAPILLTVLGALRNIKFNYFLTANSFFQCKHPFSDKTDGYY